MKNFIVSLLLLAAMPLQAYAANETGPANTVLRMPSSGSRAKFGSINLALPAVVGTSLLGPTNGGTDSSDLLSNLGFTVTESGADLIIHVTTKSGAVPSSSSPVRIGSRSEVAGTGLYSTQTITSDLQQTILGTNTLGAKSGVAATIYVYLGVQLGGHQLLFSLNKYDEGTLRNAVTTTSSNQVLWGGANAANSAIRLLGRFVATNTANDWGSISELSTVPVEEKDSGVLAYLSGNVAGFAASATKVPFNAVVNDTKGQFDTTNNRFIAAEDGFYQISTHVRIEPNSAYLIGNVIQMHVHVNGSSYLQIFNHQAGTNDSAAWSKGAGGAATVYLSAGGYAEIFLAYNGSLSTLSGGASPYSSFFSIAKVGK